MEKPTYYLWQSDFQTKADLLKMKENYSNLGFRVVTYQDGSEENDIHIGLKELIKNHFPYKQVAPS